MSLFAILIAIAPPPPPPKKKKSMSSALTTRALTRSESVERLELIWGSLFFPQSAMFEFIFGVPSPILFGPQGVFDFRPTHYI